jgi:hypothetical protein
MTSCSKYGSSTNANGRRYAIGPPAAAPEEEEEESGSVERYGKIPSGKRLHKKKENHNF